MSVLAAALPPGYQADRLTVALFVAMVVHAGFILGVGFEPEDRNRSQSSTLDIVLVQHQAEKEPDKADYLAQANQTGGGESEHKARPTTPLPAPFTSPEPRVTSASPPPQPAPAVRTPEPVRAEPAPRPAEAAPRPVLAQKHERRARKAVDAPARKPQPDSRKTPARQDKPRTEPQQTETVTAAALVSRSLAMASLSAEIDQKLRAYSKRPKRKWITAQTREYKYAAYMEAWRAKVERVGNLNYPDEARRRKLSGSLLLDVALKPNGTVLDITLRRSSGHKVLDDAAVRIVRLAAPFAPFPEAIRKDVDILHIERTWQFLSSNRLAAK